MAPRELASNVARPREIYVPWKGFNLSPDRNHLDDRLFPGSFERKAFDAENGVTVMRTFGIVENIFEPRRAAAPGIQLCLFA